MRRLALAATLAVSGLTLSTPAHAYSTRIHIVAANAIRKALIESGNGQIALRGSGQTVTLVPEDAQAIIDHPLEFRAGAVGPDNMAFPGLTDPSHAVGQRPFEQCALLQQAALIPEERAYALGCFLHGATDAVSHHFVNWLAGETYTLYPLGSSRTFSFDNAVRHISVEMVIQRSALEQDPEGFTTGALVHAIPDGFLLRAYFDEKSPLYQLMSARAQDKLGAAKAANPGASLLTVIPQAGLAPADHLVLAPVYLREIDDSRKALRASVEQTLLDLQNSATADGATLGVSAGSDGKLGTSDDQTACSAGCASLYAKYKVYVALLEPRKDAGGNLLPSAFDKLSDGLHDDLFQFLPAYVKTVENLSSKANDPLSPGQPMFSFSKSDVATAFGPLKAWGDDITAIDYLTLTKALLPQWLESVQNALQIAGINIDVTDILEALLDPIIQPIKDAVVSYVVDQAEQVIGDLVDQYVAEEASTEAEIATRLGQVAPAGVGGNTLDHFYSSGLWMHSFNAAAAALASPSSVLPVGNDPIGHGPATFDASYVLTWMQLGACKELREAVFPLGIGLDGMLSVQNPDQSVAVSPVKEEAAIECHDGSVAAFTPSPKIEACGVVSVDALISDPAHRGSISRAYPPPYGDPTIACNGAPVPGLPPPTPGAGGSGASGSGGSINATPPTAGSNDDAGCACRAAGPPPALPRGAGLAALLLGLGIVRRRRLAPVALGASLLACSAGGGSSGAGGLAGSAGTAAVGGSGGAPTGGGGSGTGATGGLAGSGAVGSSGGVGGSGASGGSGGSGAKQLMDALGKSVWHGLQTRSGKQRGVELRFDASSLLWAEVRNPFGPARLREMRTFSVDADGKGVHTTVIAPPTWPVPPNNGEKHDWSLTVVDGAPRKLLTSRDGVNEQFEEGPWPAPTSGLTAEVRVFKTGGLIAQAFCDKSTLFGPDRAVIWDFARGAGVEQPAAVDVVAGVPLDAWVDPTGLNQFAVTDVPGFDQLGGTELSDQFDFVVRYTGTVKHPGGTFALREYDDDVRDAVWAWLGSKVASANPADVFLEVQGHATPDLTVDAPSAIFPAQLLPFEAMLLRCSLPLQDIDVEASVAGGGWTVVGQLATEPAIDDGLFPPAL